MATAKHRENTDGVALQGAAPGVAEIESSSCGINVREQVGVQHQAWGAVHSANILNCSWKGATGLDLQA